MKREYCDIYNECFPQFKMSYERFCSLMDTDKSIYYDYEADGEIVAFAIVEDYAIRLICVKKDKQLTGIGSKLLADIEKDLIDKGYKQVLTGGVSSKLFIGAVSESWGFFEKKGFDRGRDCQEMLLALKDFNIEDYNFHGHDVAEYGWYKGDMAKLRDAVASVEESWVPFYDSPEKAFVGQVDGEIACFCLVEQNSQNYLTDVHGKIGMPGCVGTVPKFRNKGIALEMVALATQYLKEQNMDVSFIYFTGVQEWYAKIGYKTFLVEVFGTKNF